MLTPEQRSLRASIAANTSWANTPDRSARTEKARRANLDRFYRMVPAEITDPAQRAKAAENLKRAHYQRMAFRSAQVRRREAAA
jgi:hypothetical protein